uniref:Gustatory receptor n=2 Tax=Tetranychus urticae TaxID=32264 RepID=T1KG75_TETUR
MKSLYRRYSQCVNQRLVQNTGQVSYSTSMIRLIDNWSAPNQLVKLFNRLEKMGKATMICSHGYSQVTASTTYQVVLNLLLCFWCYLISFRFLLLAFLRDEKMRIILGDTFIGYQAHSLLNVIFFGASFLLTSVKTSLAYSESQHQMQIMTVFYNLRETWFNPVHHGLTDEDDMNFRRITCLAGLSLNLFINLSCGSIFILQIQSILLNPCFSLRTAFLQFLWLPFIDVTMFFSGYACYWFFIHIIIIISLSIQSTNSAIVRVLHLLKPKPYSVSLEKLIYLQNAHYNTISMMNNNFALPIFISFFVGSFFADLTFFCGTYIGTRNFLIDILLALLGFLIFATIIEYNLFASKSCHKIETFRKSIHRLLISTRFDLRIMLKVTRTLERMSTDRIGFYVGNLFRLDGYHSIVFLLENVSLYLLLIANISRKSL